MGEVVMVVSAAVVESGRVLLAQRAPTSSYPWAWCTPGGKVEVGESLADALARELREELGAVARSDTHLTTSIVYDIVLPLRGAPGGLRVRCNRVPRSALSGGFAPGDGVVGLGWFTAADLGHLQLAPGDAAGLHELKALVSGWDDLPAERSRKVFEVRDRSGAGAYTSKQVLGEVRGDVDRAVEVIRRQGLAGNRGRP